MIADSLKKLQAVELEMLHIFDLYCKKHNLKYYLIGGALLGAVRYGGFIPWDDDIDVAMPREDYDKLKLIWKDSMVPGYYLQSFETDVNFARCIMKLRKNNTEIIEKTTVGIKMHHGIYIDIFPIDYVNDLSNKIARRAKKIRLLMSLRAIKSGYGGKYKSIKRLIRICIHGISEEKIENSIYNLCTKENSGNQQYAILYLHNYNWKKQTHKKTVFDKGNICTFEGSLFSAPANIDEFLSKVFGGDYLQEPPEDKKKNPHNYISVRFE